MIYGTFIETKRSEFTRQINFLSRAVSRDDTRLQMQYILVEPSEVSPGKFLGVSTDGRRCHKVDPLSCPEGIGFEAGCWKPLKNMEKTAWIAKIADADIPQFPNWRRVIPTMPPNYTTQFGGFPRTALGMKHNGRNGLGDFVKFIRDFPEATVLNVMYLADLGTQDVWNVEWNSERQSMSFKSGYMQAVIMPMTE